MVHIEAEHYNKLARNLIFNICIAATMMPAHAPAQNSTLPCHLLEQEPGDWTPELLGYQLPGRSISLFSAPESGLSKGKVILGLYLRALRDPLQSGNPTAPGVLISTRVSSGSVTPSQWTSLTPPQTWGATQGATLGPWSNKQVVDFPAFDSSSPSPWVKLPLAAPHPLLIDGSVAVDIKFWSRPRSGFLGLERAMPRDVYGITTRHGRGCPQDFWPGSSGFAVPRGGPYPGSARTFGVGLSPGDWELAWAGFDRSTQALPLQYAGDPCFLHVPPQVLFPLAQRVSAAGGEWFSWIPESTLKTRALLGAVLWFQHLGLTPSNELKLSAAIRTQFTDIYAPPSLVSIHGFGPNPDTVPIQKVSHGSLVVGILIG
jgi:hypothetical protein